MRLETLKIFLNDERFLRDSDNVGLVGSNLIVGRGDDVVASLDVRTGDVTYRMPEVRKTNEIYRQKGI